MSDVLHHIAIMACALSVGFMFGRNKRKLSVPDAVIASCYVAIVEKERFVPPGSGLKVVGRKSITVKGQSFLVKIERERADG